jgi:hypothetical protein
MAWMKINDRRVRVSEIVEYWPSEEMAISVEDRERRESLMLIMLPHRSRDTWMIVFAFRGDKGDQVRYFHDKDERDAELEKLDAKFLPASSDPYRGEGL